jgi:murein DD-endopeptidase MepM/ murein hydrolase activator NlpD
VRFLAVMAVLAMLGACEDKEAASTTLDLSYIPPGVEASSACLRRAVFGDPAQSLYILPFPVGERHLITQSYCISSGGHANQLAYDFNMAIGADVLAARGGTVLETKDDSPDNGQGEGDHNYVFIQHEDGTVAFYAHLKRDSVVVEVGEWVEAGQRIAASGNSGLTGGRPHLHFGVYRGWPPREGVDVPVNFRNAHGPLDPRNGLMTDRVYVAEPWDEA